MQSLAYNCWYNCQWDAYIVILVCMYWLQMRSCNSHFLSMVKSLQLLSVARIAAGLATNWSNRTLTGFVGAQSVQDANTEWAANSFEDEADTCGVCSCDNYRLLRPIFLSYAGPFAAAGIKKGCGGFLKLYINCCWYIVLIV